MKRPILFLLLSLFCFSCYANNWRTTELTDKQLQNLESLSRTYGFIRYFYPSQELQSFDWDRFLMHGVTCILQNENGDMTTLLHQLFSPICPEIVFQKEPFPNFDNTIRAPFYIQEHQQIGEFTTLFFGEDYTPIKLMEEAKDYPQFYIHRLQNNLYVKFPLAVKELRVKTPEHRDLERELRRKNRSTAPKQYTARIADIISRGQAIYNFYAYYEEGGLPLAWSEYSKEAIRAVALCKNRRENYDVMLRFLSNVRDSHIYIWPSWVIINKVMGGYFRRYYPELQVGFAGDICYINDAGVYLEKLQRGDIITMVNNTPINEFVAQRLQYYSFSTKANGLKQLTGTSLFLSLERDEVFTIEVEKANGNTVEVKIQANHTSLSRVAPAKDFIEQHDNGIMYINLCTHTSTYENFSHYIADFQQATGIIMDVRGRPHPNDALAVLSHFITDTVSLGNLQRPVYSFPNRENIRYVEVEKWNIAPAISELSQKFSEKFEYPTPLPIAIDVPMVFLTNANTISFSETFLDIVKHYQIGTIIGEPTAGCNGDIARISRPFGTYSFTYNIFKNRDGSRFHGIGIQPDILSVPTLSDIRLGIDTQLEQAKNYLYEKRNH